MEQQWEVLLVKVVTTTDGRPEISTIGPDGQTRVVDSESASINRGLEVLADLGREGWQLVSTEAHDKARVFWMKRQVFPSGGGWATGV